MTVPLDSAIVRREKIPDAQQEDMVHLFSRYYSNVNHETFRRDLREKDWVIVLRDGARLVGFSTLQILRLSVQGAERVFLFSGDTIVERDHWRDSKLAGSFGHFMLRLIEQHPRAPIHWFLISKGYRTYRFLSVFFNRFFPVYDRATPPAEADLLRAVATAKFGKAYDPQLNLVRAGRQKDRLRPEMCSIAEGRLSDPHVSFFLKQNPGFSAGDELACIADIAKENLNRYAWRVIQNTKVEWDE